MGRLGNVLVIGGEPLLVDALRARLAASDVRVERADYSNCLLRIREVSPAVVLLPHSGPLSPRTVSRLAQAAPSAKLVVLADDVAADEISSSFRLGVDAWIDKRVEPSDLAAALRLVLGQMLVLPTAPPEPAQPAANLTDRELVILKALARGLSNRRIARELWVTEQTVKFHLTNIYRKLHVGGRTGAAAYAYQHGLVDAAHVDYEQHLPSDLAQA